MKLGFDRVFNVFLQQAEPEIKGVAEASHRACSKVIPLLVAQDMVWIWPDISPEGLAASKTTKPATIPELDDPAFVKVCICIYIFVSQIRFNACITNACVSG